MAEDHNAELFVKLYSKMALALGVTPKPQKDEELNDLLKGERLPGRYPALVTGDEGNNPEFLLAIYNPGQYIPADLHPEEKIADKYALSVLFNVVPQFSWVFKPAATTISNAYSSVLDNKETPNVGLTPGQKKKLDDAIVFIDDHYKNYKTYMEMYWLALDNYDAAYANWVNNQTGPPIPQTLKRKVQSALEDWKSIGHRNGVDSAIAVVAEYEALEPASFWKKLRDQYDAATKATDSSNGFQPVGVSPPYKSWFENVGWTEFKFTQKDMDNQSNSQVIGVSGNLDGNFGIFNVSGSGNYSQDSSYVKIDQTDLAFSCELMRVSFDRNWMNPLIFSSTAWRWAEGTPTSGTKLSTGAQINGDVPPTGSMVAVPTAAILSKNLVVTGTFNNTLVEKFNLEIKAEASVGIGPFAISGRFNMEEHRATEKGTIATNGIRAKDVQIVALVCELLPECPKPDESLPWPS